MIAIRQRAAELFWQAQAAARFLALIIPMALAVGSACAFFLWSLDAVTGVRSTITACFLAYLFSGHKPQLEHFRGTHGELLNDKVIIYKHIEHWDVHGTEVEHHDATPRELKSNSL